MSDLKKYLVIGMFNELNESLQNDSNGEIYDAITQTLSQYPNATYTELIATLKIYLLNMIDLLIESTKEDQQVVQQQVQQEEKKDLKNLDTIGSIEDEPDYES